MVWQNQSLTPKVTNPGPRAFGRSPSTLSFSVGSDLEKHFMMSFFQMKINGHKHHEYTKCTNHNRSISTIDPASIVIGRWIFSICSTWFIERPIPPCMQIIFFSISAARGSQLNRRFIRCHAQIPSLSPYQQITEVLEWQIRKENTVQYMHCQIPYHPLNALYSETKKGINVCSFMVSTY